MTLKSRMMEAASQLRATGRNVTFGIEAPLNSGVSGPSVHILEVWNQGPSPNSDPLLRVTESGLIAVLGDFPTIEMIVSYIISITTPRRSGHQ